METKNVNGRGVSKLFRMILPLLLAVVLVSCGGNDSAGSESLLTGPSSKTWTAKKELNAEGDKEKLTEAEQEQNIQFYADGRFAMGGASTLQTGTWSYDQAAKKLTLQFENQEVSETFDVVKLEEDELRLRAADGSEMVMELEK